MRVRDAFGKKFKAHNVLSGAKRIWQSKQSFDMFRPKPELGTESSTLEIAGGQAWTLTAACGIRVFVFIGLKDLPLCLPFSPFHGFFMGCWPCVFAIALWHYCFPASKMEAAI